MIDMIKKYRTRDGRDVRIYATDAGGKYPIHGAIMFDDGTWFARSWTRYGNGVIGYVNSFDLIEVTDKTNILEIRFQSSEIEDIVRKVISEIWKEEK